MPMFKEIEKPLLKLVALVLGAASTALAAQAQTFPLVDAAGLELHKVKAEATEYLGRKAVRLTTVSQEDQSGFALLPGVDFQDGTIEADIAVKITMPPGVRMPGFLGIGFRAKPDGSEYELFYLRPKNALADDQGMRNHSIQYCSEPNFGWYRLRREWPFVYESYADIQPETWTKLKIEVAGRTARIFLNGSTKPSLVVNGLKGPNLHGGISLWGYAGEESYFSNLRHHSSGSDTRKEWRRSKRGVGCEVRERCRAVSGHHEVDARWHKAQRDMVWGPRRKEADHWHLARGVR